MLAASVFRRELFNEAIGPYLADLGWLSRLCMASGKDSIGAILDLLHSWGKMCIV